MLEISNLNYHDFVNFNLKVDKSSCIAIVGANKSGKTTLFNIITGVIPTNDVCKCNNIWLNKDSFGDYLSNIGVVPCVTEAVFLFRNVLDELKYPLINLGYSSYKISKRIKRVLNDLGLSYIYNMSIEKLDVSTKQMLLYAIALLHQPKMILIDEGLLLLDEQHKKKLLDYLDRLKCQQKITIVLFTSDLNDVVDCDYLYLIDHGTIRIQGKPLEVLAKDQEFYQSGLEIPFMLDLSIKLKMYNLVDKLYGNMEDLVDRLWK